MKDKSSPDDLPANIPRPAPVRNPVRICVRGVTDKIADLKAHINSLELHQGIKAYLCDELDKLKSNGATLHLHDIEDVAAGKLGGFNLHVTVSAFQLGAVPKVD